jgi:uncharacterized protein DUF6879
MHPQKLAPLDGGPCSGGTCPAVYDDDPDLLPEELAIVGKMAPLGLRGRLADRTAPDEVVGVIRREIVEAALRPAAEPVSLAQLQSQFETFSFSAFRLETLQSYAGTGRDEQWITLLRASRRWGKVHQRVHVVTEPLTAAMEQELTEGYEGNAAAGEDIRIISVPAGGQWPISPDVSDFWLFDSSRLYEMHYAPDGTWTGASSIMDPEQVILACLTRDAALHAAVPWRTFIASRPDLQRRLAQ